MKILAISGWGSCVPLLMEMSDMGHDVKCFIKDKDSKDVGDGFVPKVEDYKESLDWCDYVISDDTGEGKILDGIRKKSIPVLGGSEMTDALEEDRHLGQRLFKSVGLKTLESEEFKTVEEAVSYVQDNPMMYVVKASGEAQNDKTTTYVGESEDGQDVIAVLEHMSQKIGGKLKSIEVQQKMDGLEVAVTAFFNGEKFVGPCLVNFEHKKLMPGHCAAGWGPNTGEMGTTAVWCDQEIGLFKKLIAPFQKPLKEMGYYGPFDVNAIMAEDGTLYPLEMTNRFGWPALPMQIETLKDNDLGEFFYALSSGKDFDLEPSDPFSLCLVIGVPPLPYMNDEIFEKYSKDMPILFTEGPTGSIYPGEAKREDDQWKVAGCSGCIAVCAAGGDSIDECTDKAYALADTIIVANKMVRNDIGKYTDESLEQLEENKLISGFILEEA